MPVQILNTGVFQTGSTGTASAGLAGASCGAQNATVTVSSTPAAAGAVSGVAVGTLGPQTAFATASALAPTIAAPVLIGSYIDENQYSGGLTHAQAISHWQSNSGQFMAAERLYEGVNQMPATIPTNVAANVAAGRLSVLSCKPLYAAASGAPLATATSQATLDTSFNAFMAGLVTGGCTGANTIIPIWHEPWFGGINGQGGNATSADFIAMYQHYAPLVHSHGFQTVFITSAASVFSDNENSYYPGDAYVDICMTDFYYPQYAAGHLLGGGGSTDPAHPADTASPPKPFGIGEFNNSTDPSLGATKSQAQAYWGYILSYFQGRLINGQPVAPLLMFNSDSGTPNAADSGVVVADGVIDPYGGGSATEYRNALIANLVTGL